MAKKGGGDGLGVVGWALLGLAGLALYHEKVGQGKQNNAALLPDNIEPYVDDLVATLNNTQYGHQWLNMGMYALRMYVRSVMPQLLLLVDVVAAVEQQSRYRRMTGPEKKHAAAQMARAQGIRI